MDKFEQRLVRLERDVRDLAERVRRLEATDKPKKLARPTIVPM